MKGIQLGKNGDIDIIPRSINGKLTGMVINDTQIQDAAVVLDLNQGELKEDPILGPNLLRFIRSHGDKAMIEKQIKIHLARIGINYEELKNIININLKTV